MANDAMGILENGGPIPYDPTHRIMDSTKTKAFQTCPRRFMWEHLAGWKKQDSSNLHLVFGSAWHLAMERLLQGLKEEGHYSDEALKESFDLFIEEYRAEFPESMDKENSPKEPANAMQALVDYAERYCDDDFEVIETEITGTVPLTDDRVIHFKIDGLCKDNNEQLFCMEHKTAGRLYNNWSDQFSLGVQIGTYTHALYCMFDPREIYGCKINGAIFRKSSNEFVRLPMRKKLDDMQAWLAHTNLWWDQMEHNMRVLAEAKVDDDVLLAFPMNTQSCTAYGTTCPYFDLCMREKNPLWMFEEGREAQPGYEVSFWNPEEEHAKNANKNVDIAAGEKL